MFQTLLIRNRSINNVVTTIEVGIMVAIMDMTVMGSFVTTMVIGN